MLFIDHTSFGSSNSAARYAAIASLGSLRAPRTRPSSLYPSLYDESSLSAAVTRPNASLGLP